MSQAITKEQYDIYKLEGIDISTLISLNPSLQNGIIQILYSTFPNLPEIISQAKESQFYKEKYLAEVKKNFDLGKLINQASYINNLNTGQERGNNREYHEDYTYNVSDFVPEIETDNIYKVIDTMRDLTECHMGDGVTYLIENQSDVTYVYKVLTNDGIKINPKYRYMGNKADFCNLWNLNVSKFIPDSVRAQNLTLDKDTFRSMCNQGVATISPGLWSTKSTETSRNKRGFDHALNIKSMLEHKLAS